LQIHVYYFLKIKGRDLMSEDEAVKNDELRNYREAA